MAEAIDMPFGMWTRVGLSNYVLDGGPALGNFRGEGAAIVKCRDYHPCMAVMLHFVELL